MGACYKKVRRLCKSEVVADIAKVISDVKDVVEEFKDDDSVNSDGPNISLDEFKRVEEKKKFVNN
jgi:hypothetical protein